MRSPRVPTGAPTPLLTLPEAAALLRLSTRTLRTWRSLGRLHVVVLGGAVRVEPREIERLIREGRT